MKLEDDNKIKSVVLELDDLDELNKYIYENSIKPISIEIITEGDFYMFVDCRFKLSYINTCRNYMIIPLDRAGSHIRGNIGGIINFVEGRFAKIMYDAGGYSGPQPWYFMLYEMKFC